MEFRRLGNSGLVVSAVGLGTNNFGLKLDAAGAAAVTHAALDAGITLFDTSDSYGESEVRLGAALGAHRDEVIVATKFGSDLARFDARNGADWGARGSRRYLRRAVESSLRRLGTDWIDLYQLHWPDPATPIAETLAALDELVREGKVRYVGSSNLAGWQVADAAWVARTEHLCPFISAQNEYNLLNRHAEHGLVPALRHFGIGLLPYYPLASGLLTGKYRRGEAPPVGSRIEAWGRQSLLSERNFAKLDKLEAFASAHGVTLLDVAIGGLAAQPTVASVIAGATSPEQVRANVAAGAWAPSPAQLAELDAATKPSH